MQKSQNRLRKPDHSSLGHGEAPAGLTTAPQRRAIIHPASACFFSSPSHSLTHKKLANFSSIKLHHRNGSIP